MRNAIFLLLGVVFGVTLYKAEIISWYRIQEMFRFHSFHMYGVMGSAVATAMLSLVILQRRRGGEAIARRPFQHGTWIGGLLFGMGWALTGACPGPLWVHVGAGTEVMLIAIASALAGVLVYAFLDDKLPH
jgi:uncharacterized protein